MENELWLIEKENFWNNLEKDIIILYVVIYFIWFKIKLLKFRKKIFVNIINFINYNYINNNNYIKKFILKKNKKNKLIIKTKDC